MEWIILSISACFEVSVMVNLQKSNGFKKLKPTIIVVISQIISIFLLSLALKTLPLNIGYATWTGLGTIGSVIFGIIYLKEDKDYRKFIFMFLIIMGIIGLKLSNS
ncbi:MAG: multidrug efflux SMR transporter [Erysipelotrichales bacterium]